MLAVVSYKICVTCDECKNILEFYRVNQNRDGFNYSCKECINEKNKLHRNKDIEHSRKISRDGAKRYYDKNKDDIQEKARSDRRKNKGIRNEKLLDRRRRYYQNNKEQHKESNRKAYEKNKDARKAKKKEYAERTKDKRNKYANNWNKEKYKNDDRYRLISLVRSRLQSAFKEYSKNGKINTCNEYGIDFDAIYKHVGARPGSGKDWHLDHIIPISVFDFDNPEHIKLSHTPENLRWFPGRLNESKGKNYIKEIFDSEILANILRIIGKYDEAYEFCFGKNIIE